MGHVKYHSAESGDSLLVLYSIYADLFMITFQCYSERHRGDLCQIAGKFVAFLNAVVIILIASKNTFKANFLYFYNGD